MFITALLPPGNIRAEINEVKAKLFSEFGFSSAFALPPIVPLHVTFGAPVAPASHAVIRQSYRISIGAPVIEGVRVCVRVTPSDTCDGLRHQIESLGLLDGCDFVPEAMNPVGIDSLYLCTLEDESVIPEDIAECMVTITCRELGWKRSELVCIELETGAEPWWSTVLMTYRFRYPLKSTARS